MCQKRPRQDGEREPQVGEQRGLYPNLDEIFDSLFPAGDEMRGESDSSGEEEGERRRGGNGSDGMVTFLMGLMNQYALRRAAEREDNRNGDNDGNGDARPRPSAPPATSGEEEPPRQEQEGQEQQHNEAECPYAHTGRRPHHDGPWTHANHFGGGWAWNPDTPRQGYYDHRRYDDDRRRRRNLRCRQSCRDFFFAVVSGLVVVGTHFGFAALFLIPLIFFPQWMIAYGLFLIAAKHLGWPVGQFAVAMVVLELLTCVDPFLLKLLAVYVVVKTFVMKKPLFDRHYWRRRFWID